MSEPRMPNAGPWPAGFTSAELQTKAGAFAAEHGLTLEPGQEWAGRLNSMTGEFSEVWPCNAPGYPQGGGWQVEAERLRASLPEEQMRADALRRVAIGLDLPEGFIVAVPDEFARLARDSILPVEVQPRRADPRSAARVALRSVARSGYWTDSPAHRRRRIALRRNLYRCRVAALLMAVVMAGAFAADRPVAGVLASALVFMLLRSAAEARAEL